jgi:hypothetical protein
MTGETTAGEEAFWIEAMLLLRRSVGVFVLECGKGILAGEGARLCIRDGDSGLGGVSGRCSSATCAFGSMVRGGSCGFGRGASCAVL